MLIEISGLARAGSFLPIDQALGRFPKPIPTPPMIAHSGFRIPGEMDFQPSGVGDKTSD
jgi:hypothetical protein